MHKVPEPRRCSPPEFQSGAATYGCAVAQELADEMERLRMQVRLERERANRWRDRLNALTGGAL